MIKPPDRYIERDDPPGFWANGLDNTCMKCGVSGFWDKFQREQHVEWHERLRRAVEEHEFLE